ncbi:MAG: tRNA-uridine aminocarboxypropyltransferase [Marinicellaceae bacterium]
MKIYLLTHERELNRGTNTGTLAMNESDGIIERVIWSRVAPDKNIVELVKSNQASLLYPVVNEPHHDIKQFKNIIILDATWQEAKKMYNQSPYLKLAKKSLIETQYQSKYQLRKNQPTGGLCTAECIIEILKTHHHKNLADKIFDKFIEFNTKK